MDTTVDTAVATSDREPAARPQDQLDLGSGDD
jgi:hypothetical protein